jgi:hypothetical protein
VFEFIEPQLFERFVYDHLDDEQENVSAHILKALKEAIVHGEKE